MSSLTRDGTANSLYRIPVVYLFVACVFCYSCSFLFVVFVCLCFFFCSHWSLVDVPLISFCPADHVPDWQPRIVLGMVEARSVNVKKTTTTAEPVSRDQILRHARGRGNTIFPVQLTTRRIGNLTRLIHILLYVMTIHTYILHTSPAATINRALLDDAETPNWQCARQSQRFGNDLVAGGEEDCNHKRAALLGRSRGELREGRDISEGIPPLLANAVCCTPGSTAIYCGGL